MWGERRLVPVQTRSSSSLTCNAQVLFSLLCRYSPASLALKLLGPKCETTHVAWAQSHCTPRCHGFSIVWACVWSFLSRPWQDQACCLIVAELRRGKQRTGWMTSALTARPSCFIDRGEAAIQHSMCVLHQVVLTVKSGSFVSQGLACVYSWTGAIYLAQSQLHS